MTMQLPIDNGFIDLLDDDSMGHVEPPQQSFAQTEVNKQDILEANVNQQTWEVYRKGLSSLLPDTHALMKHSLA